MLSGGDAKTLIEKIVNERGRHPWTALYMIARFGLWDLLRILWSCGPAVAAWQLVFLDHVASCVASGALVLQWGSHQND